MSSNSTLTFICTDVEQYECFVSCMFPHLKDAARGGRLLQASTLIGQEIQLNSFRPMGMSHQANNNPLPVVGDFPLVHSFASHLCLFISFLLLFPFHPWGSIFTFHPWGSILTSVYFILLFFPNTPS